MSYTDLTPEQQADFAAYDTYLRGLLSSLAGLARDADPAQWGAFSEANVDPLLATMPADDVLPNSTGLAGAKNLTVAEFRELHAIARALVAILNGNRALLVKAIGVNA